MGAPRDAAPGVLTRAGVNRTTPAPRAGLPAGASIAAITTTGYLGFLAGPPVVGLVADASSPRVSLFVVGALCLLAAGLAGGVRDPQRSSRRHERRSTGHAASRKASAKAARIAQ